MSDEELAAFVRPLIGRPYRVGADGPDCFDCWGIAAHVARTAFGFDLPRLDAPPEEPLALARYIRDHPERQRWRRVPAPVHGGIVEMSHAASPHHVGLWLRLDGGGVLHAHRQAGVVFQSRFALELEGWRSLFYNERIA